MDVADGMTLDPPLPTNNGHTYFNMSIVLIQQCDTSEQTNHTEGL